MAAVIPYLLGVATAPLVAKAARGTVKAFIGASLQVKKLAAETAEKFKGVATEVHFETATANAGTGPSTFVTERQIITGELRQR